MYAHVFVCLFACMYLELRQLDICSKLEAELLRILAEPRALPTHLQRQQNVSHSVTRCVALAQGKGQSREWKCVWFCGHDHQPCAGSVH
jgi:hypothetical protein